MVRRTRRSTFESGETAAMRAGREPTGGRRRRAAVGACLLLGSGLGASAATARPRGRPPTAARAAGPTVEYRLVQYPNAGFGGVAAQIARARHTIDMEMYELADPVVESDLGAAARRGVRVRVLLDHAFNGAEVNQAAYAYLTTHQVGVKWAPSGYIFHIKATSFDGSVSDVSTANLVRRDYATSRDAEIVDANPVQVRAIEATFAADWNAAPSGTPAAQTVQAPGLVWSPDTGSGTAQTALVARIAAARRSIDFTSEELSDPAIYDALAQAARRRVACRVVMTRSAEWNTAFAALTRAGCRVHLFPDTTTALYIHEKLILDDAGTASASMLLGSQNASVTSLTRNRELGIVLTGSNGGADTIQAAGATFDRDFDSSSVWTAARRRRGSRADRRPGSFRQAPARRRGGAA